MDYINETALFDKYLHKELSPEEILDFEKRLKTEPAFLESFEIHKTMIDSIILMGNDSLKTELNTIHDDRKKQFNKRIGFYLFFGFLILASIGLIRIEHLQQPTQTVNPDSIDVSIGPISQTDKKDKLTNTDTASIIHSETNKELDKRKHTIQHKKEKLKSTPSFLETSAGTKMIYIATVAKQPEYMYFNNTVHLVGWKNLTPNHIDLRVRKNKLYLYHNNTYYELEEVSTWTVATTIKDTRNFGVLQHATGKATKINVLIHPMKVERSSKQLHVFTTDSLPESQWYKLQNKHLTISLIGEKVLSKGKVVSYKNELYFKTDSQSFNLNTNGHAYKLNPITLDDWEDKHIIEIGIKPRYLNFEDEHDLEQCN